MATERKTPGTSGSEIPDLDIGAKSPSEAASHATATKAGTPSPGVSATGVASSVHDYFGSGTFDADHFGDVGGALETADSMGSASGGVAFSNEVEFSDTGALIDVSDGAPGGASGRTRARGSVHGWPTGLSPDSATLAVDAVEVRLAANYGAPPSSPILAPLYAVRVFNKRRDLCVRVKQLGNELVRSETARDDLLVSTILDLRGKVLLAEGGEDLFAPVVEIERLALDRRSALAGTNAEYERRAQEIEDGAQALRAEAARKAADVQVLAAALAKQGEIFERAAAKKKRLYIEIRAILDTAEKSGGDLTAQQTARVAELEGAVAAHSPELERAEHAVRAAEATHGAADAEGKHLAQRIAEAGRHRRALDDEFKTQIGVRSEGVSETERRRAEVLVEVMRKILAARGRIADVPKETLDGIARADEAVHARALELEKFVRAIDAYDHDAYRRGITVGAAALALLIATVAFVAFR